VIQAIVDDGPEAVLVEVDAGGPVLVARVTRPAAAELSLEPGRRVWVLVKATSLRGHVRAQR
jgi:molybdate transport system ATP-binding protein